MSIQTKFEKTFGVNNFNDNGVWIKSARTLRTLIGILGVLLPVFLYIFNFNCSKTPLDSISHYYYSTSSTFFTVILSLVGFFLIIYTKNFKLSSLAGFAILCVVFFPTSPSEKCSIVNLLNNPLRVRFHYFSAAVFLGILGYMTLFFFTKLDKEDLDVGKLKVDNKWIYQVCGVVIFLAIAVMGVYFISNKLEINERFIVFYDANYLTFWSEVVALEAFGIAWLLKGFDTPTQEKIKIHKQLNATNLNSINI